MVSRTLINAVEIVAYCFAMVPILFLGFSDEITLAVTLAVSVVIVRLVLQLFIRNKLPDTEFNVLPVLNMYSQTFNVMWFTMLGSVALILADGELIGTVWRMVVVVIGWFLLLMIMRAIGRRSPNTDEDI